MCLQTDRLSREAQAGHTPHVNPRIQRSSGPATIPELRGAWQADSKAAHGHQAKRSQGNSKGLRGGLAPPVIRANDNATVNATLWSWCRQRPRARGAVQSGRRGPAAQQLCALPPTSRPLPSGPALYGSQCLCLPGAWGATKPLHCSSALWCMLTVA